MRITRFGDYIFPAQSEFSTNFGEVMLQTVKLPGTDGGFDVYGDDLAPKAVGNVRVGLWLVADTEAQMRSKVDAIYGLVAAGRKRLYLDPRNGGALRYTWAKLNNVQSSENVRNVPHRMLKVTLNFQCEEPYWLGQGASVPYYGGGFTYGGGAVFGGGTSTYAASGTSTDITVTNNGTAHTYPRIILEPGTGQTCEDAIIQRIVGGAVVDSVSYTGTLTDVNELIIDCRNSSVTLDGAAAYNNLTVTRAYWIMLLPGANTLRVKFTNSGDACAVKVRFFTRYY